jgi:hypothetical protein
MAYSSGFNPHPRISYAGASPTGAASDREQAVDAVTAFLDRDEVLVERMTKKGMRTFNCREAVVALAAGTQATVPDAAASIAAAPDSECAILEMVLRHGTPTVRPDDVLAGLRITSGLEAAAAPLHERLAQGPLDTVTGTVGDPLALDRDTA